MPDILVGPADGSGPPHALDPELDRPIGNWTDTDLNGWMVDGRHGPAWVDDRRLVATVSDRGRAHPHVYTIDSKTGRLIERTVAATGDLTTHTIAVAAGTAEPPRIAFLATNGTSAMDLYTTDGPDPAQPRRRSTFGSAWQDRHPMPEMRRIEVPGPAGPIDTLVASPPGAGDRALPTVVDVHGGPLGAWAPAPHIEVILLVAAGYRVILPNIRGSATYGRDWIRPQLGDWGGVDAADVHAAVDHVVELGLADPERLGVFGLSYGGFMVNWLVGTTDRFKAAVSENGVTNQISGLGNSDSGPEFFRASLMGDPYGPEGIELMWRTVATAQRRGGPHAAADAPGRVRPALPASGQRAAVRRAAASTPRSRVRPLPGGVARVCVGGPAGPPDRPDDPDDRLVRPLPALRCMGRSPGCRWPQLAGVPMHLAGARCATCRPSPA